MSEQGQPGAWRWFAAAAALAAAAGALTYLVGRTTVEVLVDLRPDAPAPSFVRLDERGREALDVRLERLAPELSPTRESFVLTATGTKNPAARNAEVWIEGFAFLDEAEQDPPGSWERRGDSMVSYKVQPARLRWSGNGAKQFSLVRHLDSGIATVRTAGGEKTLDLYAAERLTPLVVPLEADEHVARYQARVPRGALRDLALVTRDVPIRVSLGTWKPLVLVSAERAPAPEQGQVIERWAPAFSEGAVRLGPTLRIEQGGSPTFLVVLLVLAFVALVARGFYLTVRAPAREKTAP
ncbi:MAG TPA: hypothetical protein VGK67_06105 [Myxococcales bacterium]|jgi:hypothetical protein